MDARARRSRTAARRRASTADRRASGATRSSVVLRAVDPNLAGVVPRDILTQPTSGERMQLTWILREGFVAGCLGAAAVALWFLIVDTIRNQRSEKHTSELQSLACVVCRLLLEKK